MSENIKYSVVVPAFNEEETIERFIEAVVPVMEKTGDVFEIIFVNDGSTDRSAEILEEAAKSDKRIKVVNLSRNFGQQAALLCGFERASGEAVIDIDIDLQDPPEVIPDMIAKWKEGFQVVHGKRVCRKGEGFFKKFTSKVYMRFLKLLTGMQIPQQTGDFKLFDRKVINTIISMPEHNRFLRGLTTWVGFKQTEVEFERNERCAGTTKYNFLKLTKLALNGIVANSDRPLLIATRIGAIVNILSVLAFVALIIVSACKIYLPLTAWLFPTVTLTGGITAMLFGITNQYTARIYDEVKNRPNFIVASETNFDEENK